MRTKKTLPGKGIGGRKTKDRLSTLYSTRTTLILTHSQPVQSHFVNNPNKLTQTPSKSLADQEQQMTLGWWVTKWIATRSSRWLEEEMRNQK